MEPVPVNLDEVTRDLEALKLRLIQMEAPELAENQAEALAAQISAIRLHLKRLKLEREADESLRAGERPQPS